MEALDLRKQHARNIPCRLFYMHPLSDLNAYDVKEHNGIERHHKMFEKFQTIWLTSLGTTLFDSVGRN